MRQTRAVWSAALWSTTTAGDDVDARIIAHSIMIKIIVDENGDVAPQQIDQSKLVPILVKTVQELEARIKTLEDA